MKKVIYPILILVVSGLIIINYLAYKSPKTHKMISTKKLYSIVNDQHLHVSLYSNHHGKYQTLDAIESVYIKDDLKRLEIVPLSIEKGTKYSYLKEHYYEYFYTFSLPTLGEYFYILDAMLEIGLKNGEKTEFPIGSFDFYKVGKHNLNIVSLYGEKHEDAYQLKSITMKFLLEEPIFIHAIELSKNHVIPYNQTVFLDSITVEIPKTTKIIDALSFKIHYSIQDVEYEEITPFYLFFESNENVLELSYITHVTRIN